MARLSAEQLLKEKQTRDPNSITSLSLDHKALSEVSCLAEFKNLERLDLAFNSLTSLEGLKPCVNLKWLSVVQNKLESLKGIEGLTKLTVLNAGKNKLISMDEVRPLVSLRALILNDNQIVSISGLDKMKDLNTLVLSRNPISEIGGSSIKVKSITKLSLSNCQIQTIGASLKSCTEMKELRLAHNDIKSLPAELAYNKKLLNLDLGNNLITRWSDLKVLENLVYLRNLNLQGNPVSNKDKLPKKVKRLLPNLHIFNAKPIDKSIRKEKSEIINDAPVAADKLEARKEKIKDQQGFDLDNVTAFDSEKESKKKRKKSNDKSLKEELSVNKEDNIMVEKGPKREKSKEEHGKPSHPGVEKEKKQKGNDKSEKSLKKEDKVHKEDSAMVENEKKAKKVKERAELDVIDDGGTSFAELFTTDIAENAEDEDKKTLKRAVDGMGGLVTYPGKKKKSKQRKVHNTLQLPQEVEIGMGGPSAWGDD